MEPLELARCLPTSPTLVLLDESLAGLSADGIDTMIAAIRRVRDKGGNGRHHRAHHAGTAQIGRSSGCAGSGPSIDALRVSYEGRRALVDVSLEVGEGEFVTILGPNGAGKSALLKAISGTVPAESGRIAYRGRDLRTLRPSERPALGIAHVPEGRRVFPSLTVMENLELCDRRYVLETGRVVLDGPREALLADARVGLT